MLKIYEKLALCELEGTVKSLITKLSDIVKEHPNTIIEIDERYNSDEYLSRLTQMIIKYDDLE